MGMEMCAFDPEGCAFHVYQLAPPMQMNTCVTLHTAKIDRLVDQDGGMSRCMGSCVPPPRRTLSWLTPVGQRLSEAESYKPQNSCLQGLRLWCTVSQECDT